MISLGECMYRFGTLMTALGTPARVTETASASVAVDPAGRLDLVGDALGDRGLDGELGERGVHAGAAVDHRAVAPA